MAISSYLLSVGIENQWLLASALAGITFILFTISSVLQKKSADQQSKRIIHLINSTETTDLQPVKAAFEQQIQDKIEAFNHAGKNINNCASDLAINAAEVAFFLDELFRAIEHSSQDADKISIAAQDMSVTTEQVTSNANIASEQSLQALQASNTGIIQIEECSPVVQKLDSGVKEGSRRIELLAAKAAEIQNITDVINAIAEQTNLLALNAAIEAARAGDQGRGFAVVADEVRALAARTGDATKQIDSMLKVINDETQFATNLMSEVSLQSEEVVATVTTISESFKNIHKLITESSSAASEISKVLSEQDQATSDISKSIVNIRDFLMTKSATTKGVSIQASGLSEGAESIFVHLKEFKTDSLIDLMCQQAQLAAEKIGTAFSQAIANNQISQHALFNFTYKEISDTNPKKFTSAFDTFTDSVLPRIQEPLLDQFEDMIYAGAVDINGYFPTHNKKFSQPLTGNYETDVNNNRTKRIFDDPTGIRCGKHTQAFLLQTYKRDTGEVMHDVSAPIIINGKHWGGFRIGFKAQH
ncbi:MAG: methyl-accepting chemotaxis protein [Oceanospirillaceae bacterium]|nr:methyl-accepting chemotaxis protein [Oceanospirillaceae bacterium]